MGKTAITLLAATLFSAVSFCQEDWSGAGADFSLEGALAMFKESVSLEDFEKAINQENNNVNNLDLNNDGQTDYINVEDIKDGDTHAIVLSTYLAEHERQDIATIGIEKTAADSAVLQIEGDEGLFPSDAIVEPQDIAAASGKGTADLTPTAIVVNVWFWPVVRYIYAPGYAVWVSPYRWAHYPRWWRPWHPVARAVFYKRAALHRVYFHPVATRRVAVARGIYAPRRQTSTLVVHLRRGTAVVHRNRRGNAKAVRVKWPRMRR